MEPSGFMISQITPPGSKPAIRARSTAASVCPARTRTPPSRARSGNTCPGRARSRGRALGSIAVRMVCARSAAEIPVETPSSRVDRFAERGAETRCVHGRDQRQVQRVAALRCQRQADQAAAMGRHEVDGFGRDGLGRNGQVALVFAVLVVHHNQHAARAKVFQSVWDGSEGHLL